MNCLQNTSHKMFSRESNHGYDTMTGGKYCLKNRLLSTVSKLVILNCCNVDTYGSESAGPEWEDCTWMDVGNVAYDLFAKSLKVCVNGIWKHVTIDVKGMFFIQNSQHTCTFSILYLGISKLNKK